MRIPDLRTVNPPPITRPGAGRGPHFPAYEKHPGRASQPVPPGYVLDAVLELLPPGQQVERRHIVERLREQFRSWAGGTPSSYTSKALSYLSDQGRVRCVSQESGKHQVWMRVQ